jgi:hypothetical protein
MPRKDNKESIVEGISLGLIPGGGKMTGVQFGLPGLAVSSVNYFKGTLNGLAIGIVNYAWHVQKGLQVGLVNIIRDNPQGLKVLPVFNTRF